MNKKTIITALLAVVTSAEKSLGRNPQGFLYDSCGSV